MLSASRLALLRSTARKTDKTTVRVEESLSVRLQGLPAAYTADGIRKLIKAQEGDATWQVKEENDRGESMTSTLKRDADESLQLYDDKPAVKPAKRGGIDPAVQPEPSVNGK